MEVLEVTAAFLMLLGNIEVNEAPSGLHDKLKGQGAEIYNDLIYYSKFNATVIPAEVVGQCDYSEILQGADCTGLVGLLHRGEANISLMQVQTEFDPRINEVPYSGLFPIGTLDSVFISPAVSDPTKVELHILSTAMTFNKVLLLSYLLFSATLVLLINLSSRSGKYMNRMKWPETLAMLLKLPVPKQFIAGHRRIAFFCALLLTFLYYQLYVSSMQTALVLDQPARYFETLEEVSNSNHTLVMVKGLNLDNLLSQSNDPIMRDISDRSEKLPLDGSQFFNTIAEYLNDNMTVALADSSIMAGIIQGFVCINSDCRPKIDLKVSRVFAETSPIMATSRGADDRVKRRFRLTNLRFADSGIYQLSFADFYSRIAPLVSSYEGRFRMCLMKMNRNMETNEAVVGEVNFHAFSVIFRVLDVSTALAFVCLLLELWWKRVSRKRL